MGQGSARAGLEGLVMRSPAAKGLAAEASRKDQAKPCRLVHAMGNTQPTGLDLNEGCRPGFVAWLRATVQG
ncbi:hypothetical protein ACFX2G_022754 [Malus domestica]